MFLELRAWPTRTQRRFTVLEKIGDVRVEITTRTRARGWMRDRGEMRRGRALSRPGQVQRGAQPLAWNNLLGCGPPGPILLKAPACGSGDW